MYFIGETRSIHPRHNRSVGIFNELVSELLSGPIGICGPNPWVCIGEDKRVLREVRVPFM